MEEDAGTLVGKLLDLAERFYDRDLLHLLPVESRLRYSFKKESEHYKSRISLHSPRVWWSIRALPALGRARQEDRELDCMKHCLKKYKENPKQANSELLRVAGTHMVHMHTCMYTCIHTYTRTCRQKKPLNLNIKIQTLGEGESVRAHAPKKVN